MATTSEIVPRDEARAALATQAQVAPIDRELVRRTVFPGANDDELSLFLHDCQRQGVHPLDRLVHPTIRVNRSNGERRYTAITSIDLMRSRAEETGAYAGNDDPVFAGEPMSSAFSATVTVYKMVANQRCAFTATARWSEYKPERDDFMWKRMPHTMLGKCAEALALRKAFPRQLAGLYGKEAMDQAGGSTPAEAPPPAKALPTRAGRLASRLRDETPTDEEIARAEDFDHEPPVDEPAAPPTRNTMIAALNRATPAARGVALTAAGAPPGGKWSALTDDMIARAYDALVGLPL